MTAAATPRSTQTPGPMTPGELPREDVPAIASAMADLAQHLFGLLLPQPASGPQDAVPAPAAPPEALPVPGAAPAAPAATAPMPAALPVPAAVQVPHQASHTIPVPVLPDALPLPELPPAATAPVTPRIARTTSLLDEISFLDD